MQRHGVGGALPSHAPAPWTTRNEAYWLPLWLSRPLPADIYAPLEATSMSCSSNDFAGGLGMIQIVRYSETPVGPYDELLIIPGNFRVPSGKQKGKNRMRITRIYVNQRETCFNGRKNWNIPKHLARFQFSAPVVEKGQSPPERLTVSVFPPESAANSDTPFFTATIVPSRYLPAFPMSTAWMPLNTTLVQPPIPQGEEALLCGTDVWRSFEVVSSTRKARLAWIDAPDEGAAAQQGYWPSVKPWSFGLWLEAAVLDIPLPDESNE